jgi:hypothetical protein
MTAADLKFTYSVQVDALNQELLIWPTLLPSWSELIKDCEVSGCSSLTIKAYYLVQFPRVFLRCPTGKNSVVIKG